MESAFTVQFENAINTLMNPAGVIGLLGLLVLVLGTLVSQQLRWLTIPLLLWVASLGFFLIVRGSGVVNELAPPLNQLRAAGRPLCIALLLGLVVPSLLASRGWRLRPLGASVISFFVFEMFFATRIALGLEPARGIASLLVYPLIFIVLAIGLGRWLQDWSDANKAIRCIVGAAILFLAGSCYQLVLNPSSAMWNGRFYGTTGNPQHAALFIATALPAICYFIARPGEAKVMRVVLSGVGGFLLIFLLWTGSRTGMAVALIGIVLLFRARVGRLLGVTLLTGAFFVLAMQIYSESTAAWSQMFLRGDTRTRIWATMWQGFLESPAWGGAAGSYGVSENSYLSVASNAGLFGLAPLMVALACMGWELYRLQRVRRYLGEHVMLADLVTASLVSWYLGAMFEGYLLGTVTFQIFCIYIFLGVMRFLLDAAALTPVSAAAGVEYSRAYVTDMTDAEWSDQLPAANDVPVSRDTVFSGSRSE